MADAKARKAAMNKARSQVRSGSGFMRRAATTGRFVSSRSTGSARSKKR